MRFSKKKIQIFPLHVYTHKSAILWLDLLGETHMFAQKSMNFVVFLVLKQMA